MRLVNKNILIVSPEPWSHIQVSKHHYALELSKENTVYFLGPPKKSFSVKLLQDGLYEVDYPGFFRGMHYLPKFLRKRLQSERFRQLERVCQTTFDILWSFDNSVWFDLDTIRDSLVTISHIVDFNMDFQFERAARSASICLGVSNPIVEKLNRFNNLSFKVNHGYYFAKSEFIEIPYSGTFKTKVGYAGNLDLRYIDWGLICRAINNHNAVGFYFAGTKGEEHVIDQYDNAIHLGVLGKKQLRGFLEQMDVLILAYKADQFPEQLSNPHKILEYFGSGTPILSTRTLEYEGNPILVMSNFNDEWIALFENMIDSDFKDNYREKRIEYARENAYEKQVKRIEQIINKVKSKV